MNNVYILSNKIIVFYKPSSLGEQLSRSIAPRDESLVGPRKSDQSIQYNTYFYENKKKVRRSCTQAYHIEPQKSILFMDCSLKKYDIKLALFIRLSYDSAKVVQIYDSDITVGVLR